MEQTSEREEAGSFGQAWKLLGAVGPRIERPVWAQKEIFLSWFCCSSCCFVFLVLGPTEST